MTTNENKPYKRELKIFLYYSENRNRLEKIFAFLKLPSVCRDVIFLPFDLIVLIMLLIVDIRIEIWTKLELILGLLYVVYPEDIVPDILPGLGIIDDFIVMCIVLNHIFNAAGKADASILRGYWAGAPITLAVIRGFFILFDKWATRLIMLAAVYKILTSI